jgi:hypothetical protein
MKIAMLIIGAVGSVIAIFGSLGTVLGGLGSTTGGVLLGNDDIANSASFVVMSGMLALVVAIEALIFSVIGGLAKSRATILMNAIAVLITGLTNIYLYNYLSGSTIAIAGILGIVGSKDGEVNDGAATRTFLTILIIIVLIATSVFSVIIKNGKQVIDSHKNEQQATSQGESSLPAPQPEGPDNEPIANPQLQATSTCKVLDPDIVGTYEGECRNGLANGLGIAKGRDEYRGRFMNGIQHGKGIYIWGEGSEWAGDIYDGENVKGERTGKATYIWRDGSRYEGNMIKGSRHGFGVMLSPKQSYKEGTGDSQGHWEGDLYIEKGIWRYNRFVRQCNTESECIEVVERLKRMAQEKGLPFIGRRTFNIAGGSGTGQSIEIDEDGGTTIKIHGVVSTGVIYKGRFTNPIIAYSDGEGYLIKDNEIYSLDGKGNIKYDCSFSGEACKSALYDVEN